MATQSFQVAIVSTEETYGLRAAVLRANMPNADPKYVEDTEPGTVHLGIFDETKTLIGTSTWAVKPWPNDESALAIQLRGMAVATSHQSSGLGKLLIDAGVIHAKNLDAKYIWAKARDAALNFYLRNGFLAVGDGFLEGVTRLPHHLVVREI